MAGASRAETRPTGASRSSKGLLLNGGRKLSANARRTGLFSSTTTVRCVLAHRPQHGLFVQWSNRSEINYFNADVMLGGKKISRLQAGQYRASVADESDMLARTFSHRRDREE